MKINLPKLLLNVFDLMLCFVVLMIGIALVGTILFFLGYLGWIAIKLLFLTMQYCLPTLIVLFIVAFIYNEWRKK